MKIYTLLRDNRELGSFTYEELLQIKLAKTDLLWIEGESIVWKYPSEMKEFTNIVREAGFTEGTIVNERKEKQISYFRWKENGYLSPVEEIAMQGKHPDAYLSDIPMGYEFLLGRVEAGDITEGILYESLREDTAQQPVDPDYTVLGAAQVIDTREGIAGPLFFESTIDLPLRYKSQKGKVKKEARPGRVLKKRKGSLKLPVLIMIITAAFMHLKV